MSVQPLEWVLDISKRLCMVVAVTQFGALCILWLLPIWIFLKLLGTALLCVNARYIVRMHLLRCSPRAVVKLWQDSNGRFGCQFQMGQSAYGQIKSDSFHSSGLIVLRLRLSERVVHVIIPRDSLPPEAYSMLACRLISLK